jgi:hypothetical protein
VACPSCGQSREVLANSASRLRTRLCRDCWRSATPGREARLRWPSTGEAEQWTATATRPAVRFKDEFKFARRGHNLHSLSTGEIYASERGEGPQDWSLSELLPATRRQEPSKRSRAAQACAGTQTAHKRDDLPGRHC